MVSFIESELAKIAAYDQKEGRHWSSPTPASATLEDLCERLRGEVEEGETAAVEVTLVVFSAPAEVSCCY